MWLQHQRDSGTLHSLPKFILFNFGGHLLGCKILVGEPMRNQQQAGLRAYSALVAFLLCLASSSELSESDDDDELSRLCFLFFLSLCFSFFLSLSLCFA